MQDTYSATLRRIINNMELYNLPESMVPTQEKFLLSLFDYLSGREHGDDEEIAQAKAVLEKRVPDVNKLRDVLLCYKMSDKDQRDSHTKYMSVLNLLESRRQGQRPITAADVVKGVFEKPSAVLSRVFSNAFGTSPSVGFDVAQAVAQSNLELEGFFSQSRHNDDNSVDGERTKETETETDADDAAPESAADAPLNGDAGSELKHMVATKNDLYEFLRAKVFGQNHAVSEFVNGYFQAEMTAATNEKNERPLATFLFAGPPGVGKTMLAKLAAKKLGYHPKTFDMSSYSDKEATTMLCGSDSVYRDSSAGALTSEVYKHPKSLLVFDEIEKAHVNVHNLFLQVLDHGVLHDHKMDKDISMKDTILIFTTNAGRQLYHETDMRDFSTLSKKVILNALKTDKNPETKEPYFPEALCSRFATGNVVMFNHLGVSDLDRICCATIDELKDQFTGKYGINITYDENVSTAILLSEGGATDGRALSGRARRFFNDEISELLTFVNSEKSGTSIEELEKIQFVVQLPQDPEMRSLFEKKHEKSSALVFADESAFKRCQAAHRELEAFRADTVDDALVILKEENVNYILLDLKVGIQDTEFLDFEDAASVSRDFLHTLLEKYSGMPVFALLSDETELTAEERISYVRQGVRGFIAADDIGALSRSLQELDSMIHRQSVVDELTRANKIVPFETAQQVSADGKTASVILFDFRQRTAVDAEDADNMLDGVSRPDVTFKDVKGAEDAKEELQFFINYLKNPKKVLKKGAGAPKGVLLYGPPGTGKTMLAKAMAHESDVTFIAAEGNQFLKSHVGGGVEAVHALFRKARKYAPSILFIDEIDAIAKQRVGLGGSSEAEATLTAFLAEMDGFKNDISKPVFVLAATNFDVEPGSRKSLDEALMRRFDRRIFVDLPNMQERFEYLKENVEKNDVFHVSDETLRNIALRTTGISIAKLKGVLDLALRMVIRSDTEEVTDDILDEALETYIGGEVKDWGRETLERVAIHEAGHALLYCLAGNTPSYLTIVARGEHGGYMQHGEEAEKHMYTREEYLGLIRCSLGGRAAEIVCYGDEDGISTGASGDLAQATYRAQYMVCKLGMDDGFGLAVVDDAEMESGEMAEKIRERVNSILDEEMKKAVALIREHRAEHRMLADALLKKNRLTGEEIDALMKTGQGAQDGYARI